MGILEGFFESVREARLQKDERRAHSAGREAAKHILADMQAGTPPPYEAEIKHRPRTMGKERFLLTAANQAVYNLSRYYDGQELPLYDDPATVLANRQGEQDNLVLVLKKPGQA